MTPRTRAEIPQARRIVVKVGSSSISGENAGQIGPLVDALAAAHGRGAEVVLVSSGAIATGMPYLRLDARPTDLATQQAAAAVGQNVLDLPLPGQPRPLRHRRRPGAAHRRRPRALDARARTRSAPWSGCWRCASCPIVNENDTVATHEIRFGDNDRLAALVAELVARRPARAALRRRRAVHEAAAPARAPSASRTCRSATRSPGVEFGAVGARRRRHRGSGDQGLRRAASPPRPAPPCSSPRRRSSPQALAGAEIGTWFDAAPVRHTAGGDSPLA